MTAIRRHSTVATLALTALLAGAGGVGAAEPTFSNPGKIDNAYLPLTKFKRCELAGVEDGARTRVIRRLLDRTKAFTIAGTTVQAPIIEDRAFEDGELVERTRDYFAQSDDGTVYYLGEHVDNYRNGKIVNHRGSWLFGKDTQKLGVAMPASPRVGSTWRFEDVPDVTTENNRVTDRLRSVRIGGRVYRNVIEVRERILPERQTEFKLYGRGVGLLREQPPDGQVELVGCTR